MVRAAAAAVLPECLLPPRFEAAAAVPLLPSGTFDRQALAGAVRRRRASGTGPVKTILTSVTR
ncbi:hypothetical protein B0I33_107274 [Prauserella shujinwangii]|uniref:Uncharacterized protein n=1 Tax=Prauserella shujinwangii TaxID=1453103 RepID=A0A2T0LSQ1_9PSEU|nr:hypothetical protein [Prauserella shujinwangii]PRX46697.1 hypothetical protein B0I33_107274 [Prauserella shujinwangii]